MADVELFIALLAGVVLLVAAARPLRVPYPVLLFVGGLGAGLLPFIGDVRVEPDAVMLVFLPPILYAAAFDFAGEDTRAKTVAISLMAVPLVLVTIGAVAWAAHVATGLPWAAAFILGALLGPTDPVSATTVISRLGGSERMRTLLEGESLVNDGTGLTAFRIAVGVAGGEAFAPGSAALEFVGVAAGGIVFGAVVGFLAVQIRRRMDTPQLEVTVSLLTAYGAFAGAERLHVSGILAAVVAGFVVGRGADVLTPQTRRFTESFWAALTFLAESLLFLLVGLAVADVAVDEGSNRILEITAQSMLLGAVILGVRLLWMYTVPYAARGGPMTGANERFLIGVSGMRGAVSVAAALAIPADIAGRDDVLLLACGTVFWTLVPVGLVLPLLVRRLGLQAQDENEERYVRARIEIAHAGLERAEELADDEDVPEALLARAREAYELRIARLQDRLPESGEGEGEAGEQYRRIRRLLVEAEQAALESAEDVKGETQREIRRELDLETSRFET